MMSILETAKSMPDFSVLVQAISALGEGVVTMVANDELTVFAPTNAAFEKALGKLGMTAEQLLADTETLKKVIQYHVVLGKHMSSEVVGMTSVTTAQGSDVAIKVADGKVWLNADSEYPAMVVQADVECTNGVIHVIDNVIMPS
jgi:transforming growth factor-beta-induced protein